MFIKIFSNFPGIEGNVPAPVQLFTDANYATVTSAGFLTGDSLISQNISNTSWVWVIYDYVAATNTGKFGLFTISMSNGIVTLEPYTAPNGVNLYGLTAAFGGGSASHAYTVTGLTSASIVNGTIYSSTNSVAIDKIVASTNTMTVTFSADPGANTVVQYSAFTPNT